MSLIFNTIAAFSLILGLSIITGWEASMIFGIAAWFFAAGVTVAIEEVRRP